VSTWNDKIVANYRAGQVHQQLGATPWHEDTGVDEDADTRERSPADDDLERFADDSAGEE
jgi:hypothetical protein